MEAEFWEERWCEDRIGFHQSSVNKRLIEHWPAVSCNPAATVFVPLCGKTLDMLWLHQQGYQVLGVELSEIAICAFFVENELPYTVKQCGRFLCFTGKDEADGIQCWAGDFFDLTAQDLIDCVAFYDRASLIAMPDGLRERYAEHLGNVLQANVRGLLLSITYDQSRMKGPPFSVPDDTVRKLLGNDFQLQEVAHYSGPERLGNLADRGLETLEERVYLMTRS